VRGSRVDVRLGEFLADPRGVLGGGVGLPRGVVGVGAVAGGVGGFGVVNPGVSVPVHVHVHVLTPPVGGVLDGSAEDLSDAGQVRQEALRGVGGALGVPHAGDRCLAVGRPDHGPDV